MYCKTRSSTITEATEKLYASKPCDIIYHADSWGLTEAQKDAFYEYLDWLDYTHDDANEDRKLARENIYVNLTDGHLYVCEMADDGTDNVEYYYSELIPDAEAIDNGEQAVFDIICKGV